MVVISIIGVRTTRPKSIAVCAASAVSPVGDQRHVEARAAHIAGDDVREARRCRRCAPPRSRRPPGRTAPSAPGVAFAVSTVITPPFDCTISNCPAKALRAEFGFEPVEIVGDDRLQIGVERRRRGALEFADLGQDVARNVDIGVRPDRLQRLCRDPLVLGIGVGVDEGDGDGLGAARQQFARARFTSSGSTAGTDGPVGQHAFAHLDAALARHHRLELAPQAPGLRPVAPAHLQHVAKAFGRDDAGLAALALQQRIGADRRAMNDGRDCRQVVRALPDAVQKAGGFAAARGRDLARSRIRRSLSSRKKRSVNVPPTSTPTTRRPVMPRPSCRKRAGGLARDVAIFDVARDRVRQRAREPGRSRRRPASRDARARPWRA